MNSFSKAPNDESGPHPGAGLFRCCLRVGIPILGSSRQAPMRDKYAITLAALPQSRYVSALEIGCAIGVLTEELASRCDRLLAIDAARTPLKEARRRCAELSTVRFEQMFVPEQWPDGAFDLILLSEIVYI